MMIAASTTPAPQRQEEFIPENHQHNLALMRTLVAELPDQPLLAPIKDFNPALKLEKAILRFAKEYAGLTSDYFSAPMMEQAKGLSTEQALYCLRDIVRTKRFLQAIDEAITKLSPGKEKIYVLDAGCGPVVILGLFATLASEKVHCTCLEINPASACFAKQIAKAFGLEDRLTVIYGDATKFKSENNQKYDLIISETMNTALVGEPIVEIFNHLMQFIAAEGLTLPSSIDFKYGYVNSEEPTFQSNDFVQYGSSEGDIFIRHQLDYWKTLFTWKPGEQLDQICFVHPLPTDQNSEFYYFVGCDVQLGSYRLAGFDSNISLPLALESFGDRTCSKGSPTGVIKVNYPVGEVYASCTGCINPRAQIELY